MERHPKKIGQTTARGVPNGTENDPKSNQIRSQMGPPIAPETLRGEKKKEQAAPAEQEEANDDC